MSEPTHPHRPGHSPRGALDDWFLPPEAARTLERVARTNLPVLCLDCHGPAFARVAAAIHDSSRRDRLILVDLRSARDAMLAGLIRATTSPRATIAIDGIELLDREAQAALLRSMEREAPRLVSASLATIDELRELCRPDFFSLVTTIAVRTPSLARRGPEIAELAALRIGRLAAELERAAPRLSPGAIEALAGHSWPGDTAELDAVLARTLIAASADPIEADHLRWSPDPCPVAAGEAPAGGRSAPGATPADPEPRAAPLPDTTEAIAVELAHQLKNPLVTVKTFVQNVAHLSTQPADLARFRDLTDQAIGRMDEALEELLAYARLGPPHPVAVDALELLRDALRDAWVAFAAKEISVSGPNGAALLTQADPEHLRVALGTLARHLLESIEPHSSLAIAIGSGGLLTLSYRESGAATHLRGATGLGPGSFPLALLLVRSTLARVGGRLDVTHEEGLVRVALGFATG